MKTQTSRRRGLPWIVSGFALQILGAALIWKTMPDFGTQAMGGVAAVVLGSLLITWGVLQGSKGSGSPEEVRRGGWLPEPELRGDPPRAVRLSKSGRRMVAWWAALLLTVPVYTWFVMQRGGAPSVDFSEDYVEGTATIHDKAERERIGAQTYYLYYHLDGGGEQVRASVSVSESDYNKYEIGDHLKVLYLAPNPAIHKVLDFAEKRSAPPVIWFAVGVAALLLGAFEMIRRRHKKITAFGRAAPGKVDMAYRRGAGYIYTVRCDAGGVENSIRGTGREPVKQGESITVLYLPEKPAEKLIYRLSMYEGMR